MTESVTMTARVLLVAIDLGQWAITQAIQAQHQGVDAVTRQAIAEAILVAGGDRHLESVGLDAGRLRRQMRQGPVQ